MRLSALNIWSSFKACRDQQRLEVKENTCHPKMVWNMRDHRGWGDKITWWEWSSLRLMGHTTPLPNKGDELLSEMKSGKVAKFRFVNVEPCYDPSDMWFATVEYVGYVEEENHES